MASLKPFVINLNDLLYLLEQVSFVPLFDGPANSNGIVDFDPLTMDAWDAKGNPVWNAGSQSGSYQGVLLDSGNVGLLGSGFPHVSSPIGVRDVSGLHNNLFGSQADWGAVDVPFRRDIAADFTNYVTSPGADYTPGNNVIDLMPRIITRTITTAGVNLLRDNGGTGAFVEWDAALYAAASPEGVAYKALIDGAGVDTAQLVEGAKIVAPVTTEVAVLDANGDPLVWHQSDYLASAVYAATLGVYGNLSFGGLYGTATGGALVDGGPIFYQPTIGTFIQIPSQFYQPSLLAYKQLVDGAGLPFISFVEGEPIVTTLENSGYGLLETLGHVDFQNPASGEYFIGSENPGVAPVNSWFGIFGQFFDHGLDLIGKGGNGKITIQLETTDPLYRAPGTNGPGDPGNTAITVTRATIAGTDANGDPNYVNHTSPFIDQSQTYGSVDQITQLLRKWESTDGGASYHAGIELFDGATLVDAWERRWPDGTSTWVNDTLPTLNELRQHVSVTGRDALTWEDVLDYRNRDASGQVSGGNSGHALIVDMNPHFDGMTGPGQGHITQAALDKLSIALGGAAGDIPAATFNIGTIMPYLNPDFSINAADPAIHEAVSDILMDSVGDHYIAGDGRVNENFGLTSIHHVFHEEHNYQVANLKSWIYAHDANNPGVADDHEQLHNWQVDTGNGIDIDGNFLNSDGSIAWDADKMFEATKLVVEMEYQHAAVDQYARTVTPRIQEFVGYSTGVDATISLEYAQVAFRFGHSTIRETIDTLDPSGWMLGNVTRYALEKAFLAPQLFAEEGVAAITLGLSRQQMNEVDEFVTPALTQGLLDQPLDLPAINIARARDLGIPTLNDFREGISLARYTSWADFGANMIHPESLVNFIAAYAFNGDVALAEAAMLDNDFMYNTGAQPAGSDGFNHIDSWIGGLAEAHVPGGLLGETFDAVFVAQIQSLMDGDRFYYLYRLFGTQIHEEVNNGQFKDIVERNTGLSHLNGSIFAYADKYYDFNRNADGQLPDGSLVLASDDLDEHLYAGSLAANPGLGIYSDGGSSTAPNGSLITLTASDFVRADVVGQYIRDVRPELDPSQVHTVEGTPTSGADSHEVIVATENRDFIHGRAGDDTLYGEGGDDFIFGDGGVDRLYGGDGDDMIDTGEGPDLADGGAGKDIIYGRGSGSEVGGFDQLVGGSGNDLVIGGEGIDKLSGGSGDDIIYGDGLTNPEMGNTDAFTHGGDGNDYIDTGASGDLLYGEEGDDYMVGGIDQDLMQGGQGDDILRPGTPSQAINGGPDEVVGDDGFTNSGFDLIDFSDYAAGAPGVVGDMVTQFNPLVAIDGNTPFPTWFQIEGVIGSVNSDTFTGTDAINPAELPNPFGGSNWLIGGSGSDTLKGLGGNDLLVGGSIRLDALIGTYVDAAAPGNLVVGSSAWLAEAMSTDGTTAGYGNDSEDAYSGASNRALGDIQANGLIDAANASGVILDKHFTEMLRSRMFKDVMLGDGGDDAASNDVAVFSGNRSDYTVETVTFGAITAYKITDNGGLLPDGTVRVVDDGTDIVVGVESFRFADVTLAAGVELLNTPPVIDGGLAAAYSVGENAAAVATLTATDTDHLPITWSIAGGADAALFTIDQNTGALAFVAAPDFEAPADAGGDNVYDLVVEVADALGAYDTQAVAVSVANADEVPTGEINIVDYQPRGGARSNFPVALKAVDTLAADPDGAIGRVGNWQRSTNGGTTWANVGPSGNLNYNATQQGQYRFVETYTDVFGAQTIASQQVVVIGATGAQTLAGTAGVDIVLGLGGNDTLLGSGGNDILDGGNGIDTVSFAALTQSVVVDLAANATIGGLTPAQTGAGTATGGEIGSDYLISIENVTGGAGDDTITGSGIANTLVGGAGADTLSGGLGADILIGGIGSDTLDLGGNDGSVDRVRFSGSGEFGDTVNNFRASGGSADRIEFGGALNTALDDGSSNDNFLFAGSNGGAGTVSITVGQGNSHAEGLLLTGTSGEGVLNASLTDAAGVAAAFNAEFNITAANGEDALLVINDTDGNSASLWYWVQSGNGEVSASEITLVGVVNANAALNSGHFDFF